MVKGMDVSREGIDRKAAKRGLSRRGGGKHHFAQLVLCVVGNTDGYGAVRFFAQPLVGFNILQFGGDIAHEGHWVWWHVAASQASSTPTSFCSSQH